MTRFVSFRFDDGFINGARSAIAALMPDPGSFFLISDFVLGGAANHSVELFNGKDFGSVTEWREFVGAGHDIQLHGRTHRNLTLLNTIDQQREVSHSLALTRLLHDGPFVFCHPFNAFVDLDFAALGVSAAGFKTTTSDQRIRFLSLRGTIDPFRLESWAVRERHLNSICNQIACLPDDSWTVLAFHSLDGEGFEPWSRVAFDSLIAYIRTLNFNIVSIGKMIQKILAN